MTAAWQPRRNLKAFGALSVGMLPVFAVYAVLTGDMRNVPMYDDYYAIVGFTLHLKSLPTLGSRLQYIIAAQHNEYKLIVEHVLVAADWALTGRLHFAFLTGIANLLVLAILWLFWRNCFTDEADTTRRLMLFAPICYFFVHLGYAENFDWAMCGLQTFTVVFFSLVSLHLLGKKPNPNIALACCSFVLACFSSGNGFLVAPIGIFILASRRRWRHLVFGARRSLSLSQAILYNYHSFTPPDQVGPVNFLSKAVFYFSFLGASVENMHHRPVPYGAVALGLFMVWALAVVWRKQILREEPFLLYAASWCLMTAIVVAQKRSAGGETLSLALRYKIYSDILLIVCYVGFVRIVMRSRLQIQRQRLLYAALLSSAMMFAATADVIGYKFLLKRRLTVRQGLDQFAADPAVNVPEVWPPPDKGSPGDAENARVVLNALIAQGIYQLPVSDRR